jgi:hypothetical protein
MYDEPQNQLRYLALDEDDARKVMLGHRPTKEDTGIYDVSFYVTRLEKKIAEQLDL